MNHPGDQVLRANRTIFSVRVFVILAALFGTLGAHAQELSYLIGGGSLPDLRSASFSWEIDYRQHLYRDLSASVSWINEGHIIGHHRDGTAAQLWLEFPMDKGRITLSAGAGGDYYFDTQPVPGGDSADIHGSAPVVSLAATAYLGDRWFARFLFNRINPSGDFRSNTAMLGIGYWFGQDKRPTPHELGAATEDKGYITGNEFTVFWGASVVNASLSGQGQAYAAEYRRGLAQHLEGTISYIYEGDPRLVRRSGIAVQIWPVNTFYDKGVTVGLGVGVYVYADKRHPGAAHQLSTGITYNTPALAPLISPTLAVRLS